MTKRGVRGRAYICSLCGVPLLSKETSLFYSLLTTFPKHLLKMAANMRGLTQVCPSKSHVKLLTVYSHSLQFIADIRGARVRELEEKRINKEMANIRKKFKGSAHPSCSFSLVLMSRCRRKFGWISEEEVSTSMSKSHMSGFNSCTDMSRRSFSRTSLGTRSMWGTWKPSTSYRVPSTVRNR